MRGRASILSPGPGSRRRHAVTAAAAGASADEGGGDRRSEPHHLKPTGARGEVAVTAAQAGWAYLDFAIHRLGTGETRSVGLPGREIALLVLSGRLEIEVGGKRLEIARQDVFRDPPHVLYLPPGDPLEMTANVPTELSVGSAPAEGRYPVRLIGPDEMRCKMRGGASARRQVNHVLAAPLPAERL